MTGPSSAVRTGPVPLCAIAFSCYCCSTVTEIVVSFAMRSMVPKLMTRPLTRDAQFDSSSPPYSRQTRSLS